MGRVPGESVFFGCLFCVCLAAQALFATMECSWRVSIKEQFLLKIAESMQLLGGFSNFEMIALSHPSSLIKTSWQKYRRQCK